MKGNVSLRYSQTPSPSLVSNIYLTTLLAAFWIHYHSNLIVHLALVLEVLHLLWSKFWSTLCYVHCVSQNKHKHHTTKVATDAAYATGAGYFVVHCHMA